MAKLKAKLVKLEDAPESAREYYTKGEDGAFYLDADGVAEMPAMLGLVKNRDALKEEKRALEAKYAGIDIDDLKAAKTELLDLKANNKGGKNDEKIAELTSTVDQLKKTAAAEKAALQAEVTKANGEKDTYIRKAEIRAVLSKHGGNPMFLEHLLEPTLKVTEGRVVVVDGSGNPRVKNSMNEVMTLDDLVTEMKAKQEFSPAFAAAGASGSGATGNTTNGGAAPGFVKAGSKEYFANLDKVASGAVKIQD